MPCSERRVDVLAGTVCSPVPTGCCTHASRKDVPPLGAAVCVLHSISVLAVPVHCSLDAGRERLVYTASAPPSTKKAPGTIAPGAHLQILLTIPYHKCHPDNCGHFRRTHITVGFSGTITWANALLCHLRMVRSSAYSSSPILAHV